MRSWAAVASLDTNCLLRWFLDDIPEQRARVETLIGSGQQLYVDDAAIIETIFVLEKGAHLSRITIQDFFTSAIAHPIRLNRALWSEVFRLWVAHPKLSVVDVYLSQKAEANHEDPLYTFDIKMVNQLDNASVVPDFN